MQLLQIYFYLAIFTFLIGIIFKTIKIARMPVHLRWELYPIPHEKGRAHYGGSYYEEPDWWKKPEKISRIGELKEIVREIFFIRTLYHNNRGLWYFSWPFHLGLYSLATLGLLIIAGIVVQSGGVDASSVSRKVISMLTVLSGAMGWVLGSVGALGLLLMRTLKIEYRRFSVRADYFNLLLLLAVFLSGLAAWLTVDRSFSQLREFAGTIITFRFSAELPAAVHFELIFAGLFLIYLPFSNMTHFVAKFFTFHRVRWDDKPNKAGGKIESQVIESLSGPLSWSAKHMQSGESWADTASGKLTTEEPGK